MLANINPERVFHYFEQLSNIPRGSGDMDKISAYCIDFAKTHNFKYYTDEMKNVVIYKDGSKGYENAAPVIMQGHLDMVCQKTEDCAIDFEKDGLCLYIDGDYVKAKGTTLGADNGIAVAMVLSILESDTIAHPPIEAVFTTDEETGMYGAHALDMSVLKSKRLINLDSEEDDCITVSCAGGSDFVATINTNRITKSGTMVTVEFKGLRGGHSGVEINSNRLNANILMGKSLCALSDIYDFDIIAINGGDKPNAITNNCKAQLCVSDAENFATNATSFLEKFRIEIADIEQNFSPVVTINYDGEFDVFGNDVKNTVINALSITKNGVIKMSENIENLVETSLNIGILKTENDTVTLHFSLRSNKQSGLMELESDIKAFYDSLSFEIKTFGHYPPWEYKEDSALRELYKASYKEHFNKDARVEAIHAGLECGIFASKIHGIDCIAVGPTINDVHTVNEKLSITSTKNFYTILLDILSKMH